MAFIGKSPQAGNFIVLDSITTSATATYNLTQNSTAYFPASARNLIVSLNGITQAPDTAYSVSGSTITFSSALTASDVIDYILVLGDVLSIGTPADNTVGEAQLNYPLTTFSSTGIDDNATETAITIDANENVEIEKQYADILFNGETGQGRITTTAGAAGGFTATNVPGGSGVNFKNSGVVELFSSNNDAAVGSLTIDTSGRVGIGDSSPDAGLTVHNNAGAVIATSNIARQTYTSVGQLQVSTAGSGGILIHTNDSAAGIGYLTFGDGATSGRILYNHSNNSMAFNTNGVQRMSIDGDGLKFGTDTAAANALDDYEEGTYTAYLYDASTGGNQASPGRTGYYTKIGRMVTVSFYGWNNIDTTGLTSTAPVYIDLPFTSASNGRHVGNVNHHGWTYSGASSGRTHIMPKVTQSTSRFYFIANGNGLSDSNVLVSDLSSGADDIVDLTLTYHV